MTGRLTVLVAIPVFDDPEGVVRAVRSVLAQTTPVTRIEVIDDGSRRDIAGAIASFGCAVEYVRRPNGGPVTARNDAIRRSREDVIAFLDSDDVMPPNRIASALAGMRDDDAVMGSVSLAQNVRPDGRALGPPVPAYTFGALVARAEAFERVGLPDEALQHGAALDWFLRMRSAGLSIALDRGCIMQRVVREDSFSTTHRARSLQEHLQVIRASLAARR